MERDKCILNNNYDNLETLFTLKKFPVSMSCVPIDYSNKDYKYMDMIFQICKDTGMIQLKNIPDLNDVYIYPHNSAYGKVWDNLFNLFNELIYKYIKNMKNIKILEIGGGSLKLASKILNEINNYDISEYLVYEKNLSTKNVNDERIKIIDSYVLSETDIPENVDLFIHSHVFEHVWNPVEFINKISNNMKIDGYHCFIIPNLQELFKNKYTNALHFEHNFFITEPFIDIILNNNNLEIIKKEFYLDHSIIYITKYSKNKFKIKSFPNMYKEYLKLGYDYFNYYNNVINDINNKINKLESNYEIYLFGAHIFSQSLIVFGLDITKINYILDNCEEKNNKKLYGTNLIIKYPEFIKNKKNICVILKAASYQKEIKEQLYDLNNDIYIIE